MYVARCNLYEMKYRNYGTNFYEPSPVTLITKHSLSCSYEGPTNNSQLSCHNGSPYPSVSVFSTTLNKASLINVLLVLLFGLAYFPLNHIHFHLRNVDVLQSQDLKRSFIRMVLKNTCPNEIKLYGHHFHYL